MNLAQLKSKFGGENQNYTEQSVIKLSWNKKRSLMYLMKNYWNWNRFIKQINKRRKSSNSTILIINPNWELRSWSHTYTLTSKPYSIDKYWSDIPSFIRMNFQCARNHWQARNTPLHTARMQVTRTIFIWSGNSRMDRWTQTQIKVKNCYNEYKMKTTSTRWHSSIYLKLI